jgi:CBS domain-containing protein
MLAAGTIFGGAPMGIGEICTREVVFVNGDETVLEAVRLMRDHHVGAVVVVEKRDIRLLPVGILTDRDVAVRVVASERAPGAVRVSEVMTSPAHTAAEGDDVYGTIERMRAKGVRRVPVVDRAGSLVGILSVDDLVDLIAEEMANLAKLVSSGTARKAPPL